MADDAAPTAAAPLSSGLASAHPVSRAREHFSLAAAAVTRLYRSPDRCKFAAAANAVTNLYRVSESDSLRACHRG